MASGTALGGLGGRHSWLNPVWVFGPSKVCLGEPWGGFWEVLGGLGTLWQVLDSKKHEKVLENTIFLKNLVFCIIWASWEVLAGL